MKSLPVMYAFYFFSLFRAVSDAPATLAQEHPETESRNQASAVTQHISLHEAVGRALRHSPNIKRSQAELEAQIESRRASWADTGPRVSAEYSQVYFDEKQKAQFGPQEMVLRDDQVKNGSLMVFQSITGLVALVDKALYDGVQEDAREIAFRFAKIETAFSVAEAYLKAFQADEQLQVAEQSIAAVSSQEKDAEALERAGRINVGDLLKIRLAVSESKARAAQARAGKEIAFAVLSEAMGLAVGTLFTIERQTPALLNQNVSDVTTAYAEALNKRLDYQQAKYAQKAATFSKDLAYARLLPNLNVFMKWDKDFGEPAGIGGGKKGEIVRSYGVQLQWDIWNNGSQVFGVRKAVSDIQAADAALEGYERQLRLDVFQTIASLKAAKEALALAEVAVQQAEEAFRIEQVRFKTGTRSATDLVLAENSQSGARVRLASARADLLVWHLRLQRALGNERPEI